MSATVLIVYPDSAVAERLGQLVLAGTPEAAVGTVGGPEEGIAALDQYDDIALCICELYFEGSDGLAFLSAIRTRFRRARVIIVSSYNLQNFGDHIQSLTVFRTPLDEAVFAATCQDTLVTLEGHEFPPFRLGPKQPPDRWGDCYAAYDTGVKRDIFITVCHSWSTPEDIERFRSFAALMARAIHPNVQAVYQAGTYQGRDFFSREKWDMLNLAEMATAGQIIDPRLAVQIIHIVGSVVIFWDSNKFPHTLVGATDISLSPQGVVKIANCVDPTQPLSPPGLGYLSAVANAVQALLPPPDEVPVRVRKLLNELLAGPVPLARLVTEAQGIDTELAPERQIAVTKEHSIARQAIAVERRKQKFTQYLMFAGFAVVVLVVGYIVYTLLFPSNSNSSPSDEMVKIPAGPFVYQAGPDTIDHDFYIDKYEVTIGQYLNFVRAVQSAGTDAAWRCPTQPADKLWTHQPDDWADIIQAIKTRTPYQKQLLTENSPIFNVDWYDAEAYAKWAGKRLPTEREWEKAARGTQGFVYPWGNTYAPKANTEEVPPGAQYMPVRTLSSVDQMPDDVSPFGVYDMGGNVSEWTDTVVPGKSGNDPVIRGGNIFVRAPEHAILTYRDTDWMAGEKAIWLGFRCASDTPPVEQK